MLLPSSKKEAIHQKSLYFYNGKPCKYGHLSKRITRSSLCYECSQKASLKCYYSTKLDLDKRKHQILNRLKNRAIRDGEAYDLTVDSVYWPTHCPVFGYELSYEVADKDRSVSFDKHDPKKGYTRENVVVMSLRANRAKWNLNVDEVKVLYEYLLSKS